MGYGIKIVNGNGDTILNTDKPWKYMEVIDYSNTGSSTISGYNNTTDILLTHFPPITSFRTYGYTQSGTTVTFKQGIHTSSSGTAISLPYLHLRSMDQLTSDSSNYGFEISNSNGDIEFDSSRLKNLERVEPDLCFSTGTLSGTKYLDGAGNLLGSNARYFNITATVPYATGNNGVFYYFSQDNDSKIYFNSFRRTASGNTTRTNPCEIIVYRAIYNDVLLQLPPGDDGVV
jgi:hypothetical protein